MSGVNKVILVGHLGKDPEVRHLENGVNVASFSLATTETITNKSGERQDLTEWHNIVVWRGLADVAEKYLKKGKQVYLEGKIRTRSWEDKEGVKRYTTEIVADTFTMLGKKDDGSPSSNPSSTKSELPSASDIVNSSVGEDDLPF
ncbi:MAG: single-stranded DNA-binding protein [Sphingobacteriales bacterium]|jgi:single-strand DNA-binding protein|nr:single-stranded DNA-binding protein [Sphingobacteriales bacterium]